jgi:ABC-2 type transport system ATP-binding protein
MIEIKDLCRHFGPIRAVDEVSFQIMPGEIVGFLGPNGAGKTTTLRMIVGFLQPTAGQITINNKDINEDPLGTSRLIGYLPEQNPLYDEMIVFDYLKYVSDLRKMPQGMFSERLSFVVSKCGLQKVMAQTVGTLSKGYRQRVGLAQAIIHDPDILILDEPTSGLDPNQILEIRDLIRELGAEKTVILSSHIMQEVQALCDRIIIINQGRIVANDTKENLSLGFAGGTRLILELEAENPDLTDLFELYPDMRLVQSSFHDGITSITLESSGDYDLKREVAKFLSKSGLLVLSMYLKQHSLEEIFHGLTRQDVTEPEIATDAEDTSIENPEDPEGEDDEHHA